MDLLSTVLQTLHIVDNVVGMFEFAPPWAFHLANATPEQVFVVGPESSPLHLQVDGELPQVVYPGDTAVILGTPFTLACAEGLVPMSFEALWFESGLPPLGQRAQRHGPACLTWPKANTAVHRDMILTLALQLEDATHNSVLSVLPRFFVLQQGVTSVYPWSLPIRRFITHEADRQRLGYEAAERCLVALTFTELIRSYVVDVGVDKASWLKGITDPKIGRALALIYSDTEEDWRLETLAEACEMARSTFSRRFQQLVGRPPMEYLLNVRMQHAGSRLAAGERVTNVAAAVGYRSEWAFRQAFVRQFGMTPKRYAQSKRTA